MKDDERTASSGESKYRNNPKRAQLQDSLAHIVIPVNEPPLLLDNVDLDEDTFTVTDVKQGLDGWLVSSTNMGDKNPIATTLWLPYAYGKVIISGPFDVNNRPAEIFRLFDMVRTVYELNEAIESCIDLLRDRSEFIGPRSTVYAADFLEQELMVGGSRHDLRESVLSTLPSESQIHSALYTYGASGFLQRLAKTCESGRSGGNRGMSLWIKDVIDDVLETAVLNAEADGGERAKLSTRRQQSRYPYLS